MCGVLYIWEGKIWHDIMKRKAKFTYDNHIGKIGEKFFYEYLCSTDGDKWRTVDVSDDPYFRDRDIDFIRMKKDVPYDSVYEGMFDYYDEGRCRNTGRSFEVKTDTYISKTRNAIYEVVVNGDSLGFAFKTTADFIVYLSYDEGTEKVDGAWVVNMPKWRWWVSKNERTRHIKKCTEENNFGGRLLLKCNIDRMVKDGVAADWSDRLAMK